MNTYFFNTTAIEKTPERQPLKGPKKCTWTVTAEQFKRVLYLQHLQK